MKFAENPFVRWRYVLDLEIVLCVFGCGNPLEVLDAIIKFVTILVIHLRLRFWIWDKSQSHNAMHLHNMVLPIAVRKRNMIIPGLTQPLRKAMRRTSGF